MDVTCARCGTEYEFDETLVSDRGTTVKYTNCSHLFKVYRPGMEPGATAPATERVWHVRRIDGNEETLSSLRELQQRITQGLLSEEDDISRSGEAWKRLGDIAELRTFFQAAEAARAAESAEDPAGASATRKQTLFGVGGPADSEPPQEGRAVRSSPRPPPRRRTRRGPLPDPASTMPARPSSQATLSAPDSPAPAKPAAAPARASGAPAAVLPPAARAKKPALYLDDEEERGASSSRSGGAGRWLALLVVLAGVSGIAAWQWPQLAPLLGIESDPVAGFVRDAKEHLQEDTPEGYEEAIRELTRASAHDERDRRVLLGLARTHAAFAQALAFEAEDLRMREDPQAVVAERDRDDHSREAARFAEQALRRNPADADATLVMADALRLRGDLVEAQEKLARAQELSETASAQLYLSRALLAAAEGGLGDAALGARQAVEADGDLLRARLLLARAALASGDVAEARGQLTAILERNPDNEYAKVLEDAIDRGVPPAAPIVAVPDGGADAATADAGPPEPTMTATPMREEPPTMAAAEASPMRRATRGGSGPPPPGRDYSWYIRRGDDLLDQSKPAQAMEYYEAAMGNRPGGVEALTGLGYASLALGRAADAARYFRPASRADYGDAYIGLGDAYRRMNRIEDAVATYQSYLQSRPNGPQASIARRQLEVLQRVLDDRPEPAPEDESAGGESGDSSSPSDSPEADEETATPSPGTDEATSLPSLGAQPPP